MGTQANGMKCEVVEWVKRNTVRWFGPIKRIQSDEFVRKVYVSETVGPNNTAVCQHTLLASFVVQWCLLEA